MSWASFITGAATKATELINDRDKEIQKKIDEQLSLMNEEAKATKKKGETRRDALKSAANQLVSLGMNPDQVAAFISGADPATLEASIKLLQSRAVSPGGITPQMTEQMVRSLPKVQETPEQVIEKLSTPVAGAAPDFGTMRGAFGLPSGAAKEAQEKAAKLRTELPELPSAAGRIDLSVFAEPEAIGDIQNRLRDAIANGEPLTSPANAKMLKQLEAAVLIKETVEGDEDLKPRSTSQINTVIDKTLRAGLEPFVLKGVVRFDTAANEYVPITGNKDALKQFFDHKNNIIRSQAEALGIIVDGRAINRNARDALLPYANIDKDGKITSWKSVGTPETKGTAPSPAPAQPKEGSTTKSAAEIDKLRADANEKIAQNPALAARVRAAFKRETGQDL